MDNSETSVHKLHWGLVPRHLAPSWLDAGSTLLAVWPAPHNADEYLRLAGFTDFADPGDAWDADWKGIVERAIDELAAYGAPRMRECIEVYEVQAGSLLERLLCMRSSRKLVDLSILEQVILLTEDDRFPDAVVDFGETSVVSLRTGDGLSILWIAITDSVRLDSEAFLTALADGLPVEQMDLD